MMSIAVNVNRIPTGYAIFTKWSNSSSEMSEISPAVGPLDISSSISHS